MAVGPYGRDGGACARDGEGVKESPEEQEHFIPRLRDKGVEGARKTRQFFIVRFCALV
jgi:hypothetical protein